jgi:uncharacterized protein YkwD
VFLKLSLLMGGKMKRTFLLMISVFLILILTTGCGGQKESTPATAATQAAGQASDATPAQVSEAPTAVAQPGTGNQDTPASSPTEEQPSEPTSEPAVPTEAGSSTPEASTTPETSSTQETSTAGSSSAPAATQAAASPDAPACVNKAAFYDDVTIPDDTVIQQGEKFTKTWRIRNEGDCSWKGYQLVYAGGEAMSSAPSNPVPDAPAGEIIDISVEMTAPVRGGTHLSYWQFSTTDGKTFGVGSGANGLLWARIKVDHTSAEASSPGASGSSTNTNVSTSGSSTPSSSSSSGGSTSTSTTAGCDYSLNPGFENQIFTMINKARADNGLAEVTRDSQLDAAALEHSLDMACNDFISHTGSDGSLWYQRVSRQGFANSNAARENIYTGSPDFGGDAKGAFTWWMNSQIHRDNILFESSSVLGISYVYSANATYGGLFTLIMARP